MAQRALPARAASIANFFLARRRRRRRRIFPPARRPPASATAQPAMAPLARTAALARNTNETKILLALSLDGGPLPADAHPRLHDAAAAAAHAAQTSASQAIALDTGIGFLDHMLHALAKHAGWSLALLCEGDLHSGRPPGPPPPPVPADTRRRQSTTTTRPRTAASPSATPSTRRSARSPAWPASATPTRRSTRPSRAPSSTSPTAPTASSTSASAASGSAS